ncbi:hypothetical protein [Poseidonocella sp. HB161398]|uniref:hypothetical protein n=1 Tax=Poseidonocella sp. HB161398 TaxID=2320855 RepID=UPI0011091660|nr:hypothetical protein [Poseidonocella sp. HB161398]
MQISEIVKSWQLFVLAVAGIAGMWISQKAETRSRFDVNATAIATAEGQMELFLSQPDYVLAYLENAYPEYAYCAALSAIQACVMAQDGRPGSGPSCIAGAAAAGDGEGVTVPARAGDALAQEIDRIAREAGLSEAALRMAGTADGDAVPLTAQTRAAEGRAAICNASLEGLQADTSLSGRFSRVSAEAECLDTLGLYRKTTCNSRLRERQRESTALQVAEAQPAQAPDRQACPPGEARPMVYPHAASEGDLGAAAQLATALQAKGWSLAEAEPAPGASKYGDVRYFHAEQKDCAERLAADVQEALGATSPLALIDLGNSYRNLPRGRMELWLAPR